MEWDGLGEKASADFFAPTFSFARCRPLILFFCKLKVKSIALGIAIFFNCFVTGKQSAGAG
jgi:hypothetical protein